MEAMEGATRARQFVSDCLSVNLPGLIDVARNQRDYDDWELPYPTKYDSYDPLYIEHGSYPVIGSFVSRTSNWVRNDMDAYGNTIYEATYAMRVFLWGQTPKEPSDRWHQPVYESCLRVRDELLALVRSTLLAHPSMGHAGDCRMNENTLTEDYLDAIKHKDGSRWMAGGVLSFDMKVQETNYGLGFAEGGDGRVFDVDVRKIQEGAGT